ncbi:unnamed protein product [Phytophthora lilii]|uniref:Unnamed protein product n=1 Tax=Phytophthora lilii TaxID=2077276 RepID=A0A9W6X0V6_9STRA|nr:unnamed protein product [Phytophthora lilii]
MLVFTTTGRLILMHAVEHGFLASILAPAGSKNFQPFDSYDKANSHSTPPLAKEYAGRNATSLSGAILSATSRRLDEANSEGESAGEGRFFIQAIKKARGGTDLFYQDLINAIKITLCEQDLAIRFVPSDAENAYNLVTRLPRVYADPDSPMSITKAHSSIMDWAAGIAGFLVPSIVLGVLSLLTMIFFLICRCCCNRCGGRYPRKEGYTLMQTLLRLLFFLLFGIGSVVDTARAYPFRNTIPAAVDDIFNATVGILNKSIDWVVKVRTPLENVRDKVDSSVDLVVAELESSDFVEDGVYGLIGRLDTFGSYSANRTLHEGCTIDTEDGGSEKLCLPCDVCTTVCSETQKASDQVASKAEPGLKELIAVRSQLNIKLVDIADLVRSAVNSKVHNADDLITALVVSRNKVNDYEDTFQRYRRGIGYDNIKSFYVANGVVALGAVGILFGLTKLKSLPILCMWHVCEIAYTLTQNWTVPLGDPGRALDACFQNEWLIDAFNLTSQLDFAQGRREFDA